MPTKDIKNTSRQGNLFCFPLRDNLNQRHSLYILRNKINWENLEERLCSFYKTYDRGRSSHSLRIMIGLVLLQSMNNTSDLKTGEILSENSYWQYFCGYEHFSQTAKISESCVRRFRQSLGKEGFEILMSSVTDLALDVGLLKKKTWNRL